MTIDTNVLLFISALVFFIGVLFFTIKYIKKSTTESSIDVLDLVKDFGDFTLTTIKDCIKIMTLDISSYETEEDFINTLSDIVTNKVLDSLSDISDNSDLNYNNINKLVAYVLYFYKDKLNISETYKKARTSIEGNTVSSAIENTNNTIDLTQQNAFTGKTIGESQAEASTTINIDNHINDFYK